MIKNFPFFSEKGVMDSVVDKKNGNNIMQKINTDNLAKSFLDFFYSTWVRNPNDFYNSGVFYEHSRLSIDGNIYNASDSINYLEKIKIGLNFNIEISKFSCMDSGSRRMDILVNGFMYKNNVKYPFSQYFLLAYFKDSWKIQNSIINIFI